jgi:hypothetical protein
MESALKKMVKMSANTASLYRLLVSALYLPKYLGLSEHHGIKATGHPVYVAHRCSISILVKRLLNTTWSSEQRLKESFYATPITPY